MNILSINIGGTRVKFPASGWKERRESGGQAKLNPASHRPVVGKFRW